jgi:hypothetical protein
MFVQVMQGKVKDAAGLRKQWDAWEQEIRPKATGFLGSTFGITPDGEFIVIARFESQEAAKANSDSPQQGAWWEETSQYVEDTMFHDCTEVELMQEGGSDDAGFVQVMQGQVSDVEKARRLDDSMRDTMRDARPDVIGGLVAWHPENGRYTNVVYFTSEAEARAAEKQMSSDQAPSPEMEKFMKEWGAINVGEMKYLDLPEPRLIS